MSLLAKSGTFFIQFMSFNLACPITDFNLLLYDPLRLNIKRIAALVDCFYVYPARTATVYLLYLCVCPCLTAGNLTAVKTYQVFLFLSSRHSLFFFCTLKASWYWNTFHSIWNIFSSHEFVTQFLPTGVNLHLFIYVYLHFSIDNIWDFTTKSCFAFQHLSLSSSPLRHHIIIIIFVDYFKTSA